MFQIKGETVDKYLGYHYYINAVMLKSKHKSPYVAVDAEASNTRVARISIETHDVEYYSGTSDEVKRDEDIFKRWIRRNHSDCAKVWGRLNPLYPVKAQPEKEK